MKKKAACIDLGRSAQRGDALLEALVGGLLLAILGMGLTYAAARMVQTQRLASGHHIVLAQMRNALETTGVQNLCNGMSAPLQVRTQGAGSGARGEFIDLYEPDTLPRPECTSGAVTISLPSDASLPAVSASDVVTRMTLSSPDGDDSSSRALLGPGSLVLSQ